MADLIESYIHYCQEQEQTKDNPNRANQAYRKRHEIFKQLKKLGRLSELEPLLDHEDLAVSSPTATYYLIVNEQLALEKLRQIAAMGGMDGLGAETVISEWKSGSLVVDH